MKEVLLTIAAKDYTIRLENDFADFFEKDLDRLLDSKNQISVKELLTAFIQKCHEDFKQTEKTKEIYKKLEEI